MVSCIVALHAQIVLLQHMHTWCTHSVACELISLCPRYNSLHRRRLARVNSLLYPVDQWGESPLEREQRALVNFEAAEVSFLSRSHIYSADDV